MPDYGWDTAGWVGDPMASAVTSHYGNGFWIRYFSPSPGANVIDGSSSGANNEIGAMSSHGSHHLATISEPTQSRLAAGGATGRTYGTNDAATLISSILQVWEWVSAVSIPSQLMCYLCMEQSSSLATAYWDAWAAYVNTAEVSGAFPFYAALYCNPDSPEPNCSVVSAASGTSSCAGIWTSTPEPCSRCLTRFADLSGWAGVPCSGLHTYMWQYAEYNGCGSDTCGNKVLPAVVDLDAASTEWQALDRMLSF